MKAVIVTCHRPYNYGAVLQCYALVQWLRKNGVEVAVLDYFPRGERKNIWNRMIRAAIRWPDFARCKQVFWGFLQEHIPLTPQCYHSADDVIKDFPQAHLYIAGSDQIWNCDLSNGKDDTYFLHFAAGKKRISYAASLAMDAIPDLQKVRYAALLKDFLAVSVREAGAIPLLEELHVHPVLVADPVFLLNARQWSSFTDKAGHRSKAPRKKPYILVISYRRQKELYTYARLLAKHYGYEVYTLSNLWSDIRFDHDRFIWNPDIPSFVRLIAEAEHVVTNSYHCLCFSVIYHRQLHIFRHLDAGNNRMADFMSDTGLANRWVDQKSLTKLLTAPIDFDRVDQRLQKIVAQSEMFLNQSLAECR